MFGAVFDSAEPVKLLLQVVPLGEAVETEVLWSGVGHENSSFVPDVHCLPNWWMCAVYGELDLFGAIRADCRCLRHLIRGTCGRPWDLRGARRA